MLEIVGRVVGLFDIALSILLARLLIIGFIPVNLTTICFSVIIFLIGVWLLLGNNKMSMKIRCGKCGKKFSTETDDRGIPKEWFCEKCRKNDRGGEGRVRDDGGKTS